MNLTASMAMACALLVATSAILFNRYQAAVVREKAAAERADKAEAALKLAAEHEKVVTKYVDKVVTIEKRVPGAVRHIYSLCDTPAGVPGAGDPDEASPADARDRRIAGLAADAAACRQNAEQLSALQEVLRGQLR